MRRSRKLSLNVTGLFHKMWRGHNREHIFADNNEKLDYLEQLGASRSEATDLLVQWHSYCLMGNHTHETGSIQKDAENKSFVAGVQEFGHWMRRTHSRFGARFNRRHKRQGKVAYDRPKTCEIENNFHLLRVMFYVDANPVRAGIVTHPSRYRYSSYQYYAHGRRNRFTKYLIPPKAYLDLGKTPDERQRKYREHCDQYLREAGFIEDDPSKDMESHFIGTPTWGRARRALMGTSIKARAAPA